MVDCNSKTTMSIKRQRTSPEYDDFEIMADQPVADKKQYPKMTSRCCPKILVKTIHDMTEVQKNAIKDIGFEHVLSLKVTEVPSRLCYWVLDNFDPRSCEIRLEGRRIRVYPEDVCRVLGFPRGNRIIEKKKNRNQSELTALWRRLFTGTGGKVVASTLASKVLDTKDGGEWFKRHFMILLTACLIESNSTGYISPQIMHCFEVVSQISEWDWGDFVIKCLIEHKLSWEKNKNNSFVGPTLFITAFYVDRLILYNRTVPRSYPTIANWNDALLRKREVREVRSGGFGGGYPDEPIDINNFIHQTSCDHNVAQVDSHVNYDMTSLKKHSSSFDVKKYVENFMVLAQSTAGKMVELMTMIEDAPPAMKDSMQYNQMIEATQNLIGSNKMSDGTQTKSQLMSKESDGDFWMLAESMIQEIEEAMVKRNDFHVKVDEFPSFSLGLTQAELGGFEKDSANVNDLFVDASRSRGTESECLEEENQVELPDNNEIMLDLSNGNLDAINNDSMIIEQNCFRREEILEDDRMHQKSDMQQGQLFHTESLMREALANENGDIKSIVMYSDKGNQMPQECTDGTSHVMVRRDRTTLKRTSKFSSPFITRAINMAERLSKLERELCFYALHNSTSKIEKILFANHLVELRRREMLTMRVGLFISIAIIDVWSVILNHKENLRAAYSPARFFATTYPCLHTVVDPPRDWETVRLYDTFNERLSAEIENCQSMELKDIDLIFFPIIKSGHFLVVCVNVRKNRVEVIDNGRSKNESTSVTKYGSMLEILRRMFAKYMLINGQVAKARNLEKAEICVLDLPWVDMSNNSDCGIYTMRHMETYKGECRKWKTGFKQNSNTQMRYLRVKYCAAILAAENNIIRDKIIKKANLYYRLACEDGPLKLDDIVLGKLG